MEAITAIAATLNALRTSLDLAKGAIATRDDMKLAELDKSLHKEIIDVQSAAIELLGKLSTATDEIDALKDRERELRREIAGIKERVAERAKYRLHELTDGIFVLACDAQTNDAGTTEPAHYLCQPCMDNEAKKGVLQRKGGPVNVTLVCNLCKASYFTGERHPRHPHAGGGFYA